MSTEIAPLRMRVDGDGGKTIECCMYGGTAEQVRWLLQSPPSPGTGTSALDAALAGVEGGRDRLLWAVAHPSAERRVWCSQRLLSDLWRVDRGLGPYPLLDLLATYQTEHAYYPAYRDHLVHQLRVWLLGLYLLQRLPDLHAAVAGEVTTEPAWTAAEGAQVRAEVLRRWRLTAGWHDLGYVFEVQSARAPQELIDRTFAALDATFATPVAGLGVIDRDQEIRWQHEAPYEAPLPALPRLGSFDSLVSGRHAEIWRHLAPAGWQAGLAGTDEASGGLEPYLALCRSGDLATASRPGFLDHGIAGAVLLLHLHRFTAAYAQRLATAMSGSDQPAVAEVAELTGGATGTVLAAARAIALHNIVPGLPTAAAATARGLTPTRFRLRLRPDGDRPATPLASLLALADGLQEWDRPRFTAPRAPEEIGLIDQEVTLTAGAGRVWLRYELDEPEAGIRFAATRDELAARLAGIDQLLACGIARQTAPLLVSEARPVELAGPGSWDLRPYLEAVVAECGTIELRGIMPRGRARGAITVPIEELYAPLAVEGGDGDDLWRLLVDPGRRHRAAEVAGEGLRTSGATTPRVLLLVGAPGSGKSTFLRMTAAVLAHALLGEQWAADHAAARAFAEAGRDLPVPVLIRLSELTRFMLDADRQGDLAVDAPALIAAYLTHWAGSRRTGIPAAAIESWLGSGTAVLLLDGLDEIPSRQLRERMTTIIDRAIAAPVYGACCFCLTSRPLPDEADHPSLLPCTIAGLGDQAIELFLTRWAATVSGGTDEGDGARYTADLLGQVQRAPPAIRAMLRNPLMLTCLAVIHWNERSLPEQRAGLLDAIVTWLLRAHHVADGSVPDLGEHHRRRIFQALALAMHCRPGGRVREMLLADAAAAVSPHCTGTTEEQRRLAAEQILEAEVVASGIVTLRGDDLLQLWHLSFQEYLVADLLVTTPDERWSEVLTGERLFDPEWREVVLLLAGSLGDSERTQKLLELILAPARGRRMARGLIDVVFGRPGRGRLAAKARAYGLAIAIVHDLRPYRFVPASDLGLEQLGDEVMQVFEPAGSSVPLPVRVAAAEALGRAGDPRLSRDDDELLLPVPGHEILLGRYPVTVQEYQRFVDHQGYHRQRWWSDEGWGWREQEGWQGPGDWQEQLEHPSRPVVRVSWYEADAFCRWLMESSSRTVRLPTGEEWLAACATGGDYPWGKTEPTPEHANFGRNVGAPTPVGLFPRGAGPHGHLDLAGNVWEWSADQAGEPGGRDRLVFQRGGCWFFPAPLLRAAFRSGFPAGHRGGLVGFRVAVARASTVIAGSRGSAPGRDKRADSSIG